MVESKLDSTDDREPEMKVKTTTPITISTMQKILSRELLPDISP